mgnify:CR=1 FL=1
MTDLIDNEAFENHFKGLPKDIVGQMVQIFIEDYPAQLEGIETAINEQNAKGLKDSAHSFKGMLRSIYSTPLADIAQKLETLGLENKFEEAQKEYRELKDLIPEVIEILKGYI